jgi:hypothetical protein
MELRSESSFDYNKFYHLGKAEIHNFYDTCYITTNLFYKICTTLMGNKNLLLPGCQLKTGCVPTLFYKANFQCYYITLVLLNIFKASHNAVSHGNE